MIFYKGDIIKPIAITGQYLLYYVIEADNVCIDIMAIDLFYDAHYKVKNADYYYELVTSILREEIV